MSDPLVSIIILTHFPRGAMLKRAIASGLAQTFQDFEIIAVDSGHHPETQATAESFNEPRIRYHQIPQDKTVGGGRNAGIRLARGRYIAFLDDDDEWLPTKLEEQIHLFRTTDLSDVGLVTCPVWIVNDTLGRMRQEPLFERPRRGYLFNEALSLAGASGAIPSRHTAMVFLKNALTDVGLYDERFLCADDWDLLIRLTQRWQIDVVSEPLALCHYHYQGDRATARKKELGDHKLLIKKYHYLLASLPKTLATYWYLLASDYMRANERGHCRSSVWDAVKHHPRWIAAWILLFASLSPPSFWAYRSLLNLRSHLGWRLLGKKTPPEKGGNRGAMA